MMLFMLYMRVFMCIRVSEVAQSIIAALRQHSLSFSQTDNAMSSSRSLVIWLSRSLFLSLVVSRALVYWTFLY